MSLTLYVICLCAYGVFGFFISHSLCRIYDAQLPWIKEYLERRRHEKALNSALPTLLLQLASFLRAGQAITPAMAYLSQSQKGALLHAALQEKRSVFQHTPFHTLLTFLRVSILTSKKSGIALSEILEKISRLWREQSALEEKVRVLSYPLRAQVIMAVLLPWIVLSIFASLDPALIQNAFSHRWGGVGFSTALGMECLGLTWIQRILKT